MAFREIPENQPLAVADVTGNVETGIPDAELVEWKKGGDGIRWKLACKGRDWEITQT